MFTKTVPATKYEPEHEEPSVFRILAAALVVFLALIILYGSWFTVSPGYKGIVTRLGGVQETTYDEGLHFKLPLIDTERDINTQTLTFTGKDVDAGTKDLQTIHTTMAVQFSIDASAVREVYRNYRDVETLTDRALQPSIEEVLKAVTAKYEASELLTKRQIVHDEILMKLREKLKPHYVSVKDINITNFAFSKGFSEAVEQKVIAEQSAQKATNDLVRIRTEGEQKVVSARANAEAIRMQAEAITKQGGAEYVQLQAIAKWNGVLPQYTGGAMPLLNFGKP